MADPARPPSTLEARLIQHGQQQVLRFWGELGADQREELVRQLESIDFAELDDLIARLAHGTEASAPDPGLVRPVAVTRLPRTDGDRVAWRRAAEIGESLMNAGEVAVVIVAGGQGTRLNFEGPKGTFPIGPVSAASLFQIHAEKVRALSKRYGKLVPLYIMTSPENHQDTVRFFAAHDHFGLDHLRFFVQGQMPAVDRETCRLLLAEKGRLALSPDGHGGTLRALNAAAPNGGASCLAEMRDRGIRTIFYLQVDNPLVQMCDLAFLGLHRQQEAEISFKVVEKIAPEERVGVVVEVEGKPRVIEYSDLPMELAERRDPDGGLQLWAGSIAIHVLELEFVERLVSGDRRLPFHRAVKKVPYVDDRGVLIEPTAPNAVKFEQFIFDALPLAERWALMETARAREFEPLKNATGTESPASVRQRMSDLFAGWLDQAGAEVARRPDGTAAFGIEISPLFALDAAELKTKVPPGKVVKGPLYLR